MEPPHPCDRLKSFDCLWPNFGQVFDPNLELRSIPSAYLLEDGCDMLRPGALEMDDPEPGQ